ncbi:MAG: 1-acyl-sn-glycerol-3-phosphate acyltransferase [Polyangia bacterium]
MSVLELDPRDARSARLVSALLPIAETVCKHYVRLEVEGLENILKTPALFVGNHSGGISGPDIACTLSTLWRQLGPDYPLYALAHDFAMRMFTPFGRVIGLFGAIAATRHNALRVFEAGGSVLVYPGGDIDAYRTFAERDRVRILPRNGYIDTARAGGVPIVPIVAQGAHRSAYIFSDGKDLARRLNLKKLMRTERFPMALALPWGLALGPAMPYLPLPFRIKLRILPPMQFGSHVAAIDASAEVQAAMQQAMDELAA